MSNPNFVESPQPELTEQQRLSAIAIQEASLDITRRQQMRPTTIEEIESAWKFALSEVTLSLEEYDRYNA